MDEKAFANRLKLLPMLAILCAYVVLLIFWRDKVPAGLFNDTAAEALRGLYLVEGHHFEVITLSLGNSAETLYLYLVGAAAHWLGATTLSIHLLSWLFALACILLVWKLTEAVDSAIPAWIPVLTAACSLWLFHYARSGLRAIAAPFFLGVFALLLDRTERRPENRISGALCGLTLGLSIYAYTSCRVLPIAFLAYVAFRIVRHPEKRKDLTKCYSTIFTYALLISIPNLLFFVRQPKEFLFRGSYVLVGTKVDKAFNVLSSALLPFYYPNMYRDVHGRGFIFDPISAALTALGHNPVHIVFAVALLIGLASARRFMDKPVYVFLACTWILTILSLGLAGPSLTRFLIILPVYLVLASLGAGLLLRSFPAMRGGILVILLSVGFSDIYAYLLRIGESEAYSSYFSEAVDSIADSADKLSSQGRRVLCVVARDKAVVDFLTHDQRSRVKTVEFYRQPLNPAQIPFNEFQPTDLLIENIPPFNIFTGRSFPRAWRIATENEGRFYHIHFPEP